MLHRLREAARTESFNRPLAGEIEVNESRFGGRERNKHANKRIGPDVNGGKGKAVLFGMLRRGGELRVKQVTDVQRRTLLREIGHNIRRGSTIHTDEHTGYLGLEGRGYRHTTVNHRRLYRFIRSRRRFSPTRVGIGAWLRHSGLERSIRLRPPHLDDRFGSDSEMTSVDHYGCNQAVMRHCRADQGPSP
jgi:transposase-like protein